MSETTVAAPTSLEMTRTRQLDLWESKLQLLFDQAIPEKAEWTNGLGICSALQIMAGLDTEFYRPSTGGNSLGNCQLTREGWLEWSDQPNNLDRAATVLKPVRLTFWNGGKYLHEAHFVLEVGALPPAHEESTKRSSGIEEVLDLGDGRYAPLSQWDALVDLGVARSCEIRRLSRSLEPARYALFSKGSLFHTQRSVAGINFNAYDALHNDPDAFMRVVTALADIPIEA